MRTRITLALVAVLLVPLVAAGSASRPAPVSTLTALRVDAFDHEPPSTTAPSTTVAPTTTSTTLAPTTTIEVTSTTSEPEVEAQPSPSTTKPRPRPATSAATAAEPTSTVPSTEPAPPETTTTAAPEPEPAPSALCVSVYGSPAPDWLAGAILAAGWPSDQLTNVCKIAGCESNFHTTSHGSSGVYGLMQVMARSRPWSGILEAHGWDKDSLYDPVINLTVAHEGWALMGSVWSSSQWSCTYALRH